jgi:hypothetical protein
MRYLLSFLFVVLVPSPSDNPPAKEWQPLIDATTSAIRKKDAPALGGLLMSYVELAAACSNTAADAKQAEEHDRRRPKSAAGALDDCNIMNWKTAKFVSASGGEPSPSKCDRYKPAKAISLLYDDAPLMWTITLEPAVLNGKQLLQTAPNCLSSMKK